MSSTPKNKIKVFSDWYIREGIYMLLTQLWNDIGCKLGKFDAF
jgi:hypothetical protein